MHTHARIFLAALSAAVVLGAAIITASAGNFRFSNQNFRIVWTPLEFTLEAIATPVRCNVTLEGSFHSASITKSFRAAIGWISRAALNVCSGGTATLEQGSLPWRIQYTGFTGTLPNITGVDIEVLGLGVSIDPEGSPPKCSTQTTTEHPAWLIFNVSGGTITGLRANESTAIPARTGFYLCEIAGEWFLAGTGRVTVLGTTTSVIRVSLI